jgi:ppGpp synthetase/RelA/SpoT-type nucleotidyltranferase
MIVPGAIQRSFCYCLPYLNEVERRVSDIVGNFSTRHGYAFLGRMKEAESLVDKIETGRFGSWAELDDLYACAVIVPTVSEEDDVLTFLQDRFRQAALRKRGSTSKDPTSFRFDTTRFIGRLKPPTGVDDNAAMFHLSFEVQVRTAFEHAWMATTHALAYKPDRVDWRDLRLAAQLKAAVEQLDELVAGFQATAGRISEQKWPEITAQRNVAEFFLAKVQDGSIPPEMAPASWFRFSGNLVTVVRRVARSAKFGEIESRTKEVLDGVQRYMDQNKKMGLPRSLTLLQSCLGIMAEMGLLTGPIREYTPLLTDELLDLFPKSRVLAPGFNPEASSLA